MKTTRLVSAFVLAIFCSKVMAQQDDRPVRITIHPQKISEPELKYRLLPAATELVSGDAAQIYLLAFGQRVEGIGFPEFNQMVEASAEEFPVEQARQFVKRYDAANALNYLQVASRRQSCSWDLTDREQGFASPALNYLDESAQWYGGLICLKARVAISEGRFDEAANALRTGFAMSRNLSHDVPLSQSMDALFVDSLMCGDVLRWAQRPGAPNLYWPLLGLSGHYPALRAAIGNESAMLARSFPGIEHAQNLRADESRDILRRMSTQIGRRDEMQTIVEMMRDYPTAKRRLVERGLLSAQSADAMPANSLMLMWYYDEYLRAFDTLTKYLALPPWQAAPAAREALKQVMEGEQSSNPLIAMLPHYPDAIVRFAQADRRVAMLATLEALRDFAAGHGNMLPESLEQLAGKTPAPVDRITGKAFAYQKTAEGATLSAPAAQNTRAAPERTWNISIAH